MLIRMTLAPSKASARRLCWPFVAVCQLLQQNCPLLRSNKWLVGGLRGARRGPLVGGNSLKAVHTRCRSVYNLLSVSHTPFPLNAALPCNIYITSLLVWCPSFCLVLQLFSLALSCALPCVLQCRAVLPADTVAGESLPARGNTLLLSVRIMSRFQSLKLFLKSF